MSSERPYLRNVWQREVSMKYKKKLRFYWLALLGLGIVQTLSGQETGLIKNLKKEIAADETLNASAHRVAKNKLADNYCALAKLYEYHQPDSAIAYAAKSLTIATTENYIAGIGNAFNELGIGYLYTRQGLKAIPYFEKSLGIRMQMADSNKVGWSYNNLAMAWGDAGNYENAVKYHSKALEMQKTLHDTTGIEAAYGKRGQLFLLLGDLPAATNDFLNLVKISEAAADKEQQASGYAYLAKTYDLMGNWSLALKNYQLSAATFSMVNNKAGLLRAYLCQGDIAVKQKNYDTAVQFYHQAIILSKTYDVDNYELFNTYKQLANVCILQSKLNEAKAAAENALHIGEKIKDNYRLALAYNLLGNILALQNNLNLAQRYQLKSLAFANETESKEVKIEVYGSLAELNKKLNKYKQAFEFERLYRLTADSVINNEAERKITSLQAQYFFKKQEDSLMAQQQITNAANLQQIQKQKTYTAIVTAGVLITLLLLFLLYRNYQSQRKVAAAMTEARIKAEQSEKFKERFLADMSHEIRTPMNAVLGMSNLMAETSLNEKQQNYVNAIIRSSENLLVVLNDILDLSKLEEGKMSLDIRPFSVQQKVNDVLTLLEVKAIEKGISLLSEIKEDVPQNLAGDAARLNQVLINLIGNAIKFTSVGSVKLTVALVPGSDPIKPQISFSVRDTGIGMTAEQQSRIFKSFEQGDSGINRKYGGTGLGLAICKTLVELQGGQITVKSVLHQGSEFTFAIPYSVAADPPAVIGAKTAEDDIIRLSQLKVLIAEDNELNQIVMHDTLRKIAPGITISLAKNGSVVVNKLSETKFDIVFMDIHMPEMDGYETTAYIRNIMGLDIPIIALTASVIRGDYDKCMRVGMNGYIPKPFKRNQLLEELLKYA